MNFITQVCRILVGGLFIFSGLIKLNDPMGFSFKLDEYFGPDVLNLPFLQPIALGLAVFIVILEVLLGVALLLGHWKKLTAWLLLLMILFFTFLTFYSAYFNKVTDCGCFGDAIPLTPWESFGKDVILTVLIVIIFTNLKYIRPVLSAGGRSAVMVLALIGCSFMGYYVLNHLPIKDFRAYAEGKSIVEGMKSAEELGLEPTKYGTVYYMKNKENGDEKKITSEQYMAEEWWKKKEWEIQSDKTESVVLKHGYEPPVHDFVILYNDEDATQEVLEAPVVFLVIAYDMSKTDREAYARVNEFAEAVQSADYPIIGLSASLDSEVEKMRHELQTPFPFATMDLTTLKTIIRSNPGLVMLKEGTVAGKWHYNDIPDFEKDIKPML
ncbi:MAG TPA: DoxX family protein [Cryomorphaceae bacterium]|nr:DoxX family protein [Owenweeksia sp.]MBF98638.1 DoxX family protein [Owenweeksia sp.]HAD98290.1 DoxX family protein [Cryomorphaceae bacterium]HBF21912.1 DoxX family protein [Cryomorphaceae bacterium]HCQ14865.1 DoxX family protein [Cryomorphaceae bacterium]|tara:strand:+ start:980 stop:2125 length:1146 start_codon:yes stop_codon:yes gene_type:complete